MTWMSQIERATIKTEILDLINQEQDKWMARNDGMDIAKANENHGAYVALRDLRKRVMEEISTEGRDG